jgi:hypothetical protein
MKIKKSKTHMPYVERICKHVATALCVLQVTKNYNKKLGHFMISAVILGLSGVSGSHGGEYEDDRLRS